MRTWWLVGNLWREQGVTRPRTNFRAPRMCLCFLPGARAAVASDRTARYCCNVPAVRDDRTAFQQRFPQHSSPPAFSGHTRQHALPAILSFLVLHGFRTIDAQNFVKMIGVRRIAPMVAWDSTLQLTASAFPTLLTSLSSLIVPGT